MREGPNRLGSRRALVDTSAFYAFSDSDDNNHEPAVRIARKLGTEEWQLLTTNFLVAEAHALHLNRLGRYAAREFLRRVRAGAVVIVRLTEDDEQRAVGIIEKYQDKDFSLVDATSFAVMERLGIPYAFTFDRHFAQYGVALLRP